MDDDHPGMSADDWLKFANGQQSKIEEPGPDDQQDTPEDDPNPLGIWNAGTDSYDNIPPRGWLLGNIFCRQFVSSLIAEGGAGKSSVRLAQLISLALGRSLTGEHVHHRCRVLIVSLEDGRDELRRRVYAMFRHYNIDPKYLDGWLYLSCAKGIKLAEIREGSQALGKLGDYLRSAITTLKIDITSLDPYIKTHSLDENSNGAMDYVCDIVASMAVELDCAFDLPHHTNKGTAPTPGDVNRGRGGTAMKDAARLVYTLTTMTPEESQQFGVDDADRRSLVRQDSAKVNIAPPSREAKWFRLVGVRLGNSTDAYPAGDEVQAVEPWQPAGLWEDTSIPTLNTILDEIDRAEGLTPPHRYSKAPNATHGAWTVIVRHFPEKNEKQARAMIQTWVKSGLLVERPYRDTKKGKDRLGLHVDPSKKRPE